MVRDVPEAPVPPQPVRRRAKRFIDRESECQSLDQLLASVQAGESRALVLYGEAGVGKTELLEFLSGRASDDGCRVVRTSGVESEMELALAGRSAT
jgi:Cdc6-like AAA superfamily ATPase